MRNSFILMFSFFLLLGSCRKELNGEVTIKLTKSMSNSDIKLTFISFEDSRCPKGSNCITAGYTGVQLELESLKENFNGGCHLGNVGSPHPQECIFQNYKIEYLDLNPYPETDVDPKKTEVNLRVTKL